jgi:2-hydroxychromene-2-carboxylate isomerase
VTHGPSSWTFAPGANAGKPSPHNNKQSALTMSKTVEFYFDLGSPATYLAYTQLPKICEQTDSQLIYIPILLGGVFKATGNASPAAIPAKGRYMFQDLDRYAKRYGVPLKFNPLSYQHPDADARRHRHAVAPS